VIVFGDIEDFFKIYLVKKPQFSLYLIKYALLGDLG